MNIRSDHNIVKDIAVTVKIKNWKLRNAAWTQNFRNEQIKENASDKDIKISIEKDITRVVNDRNQLSENIVVVDKIDNKRLNRLTEVHLKFNEMIRNVNSTVFVAANEISIDEEWDRIDEKNFEIFDHFYNSKNV